MKNDCEPIFTKDYLPHLQTPFSIHLGHWRPGHRHQDAALHLLNQRYRLVHRIGPSLNFPTLLAPDLALLEIGKLPEMVHRVEVANLHKPSSDTLHHLATSLEAASPVSLPLKEIARAERVRAQLKEATKLAGWRSWPERKLLHERAVFAADKRSKLLLEGRVFGVLRDAVQRCVVALVPLIFPDMD